MKKAILVLFYIFIVNGLFGQVPRLILIEDFTEASSAEAFLSAPGISDMLENNSTDIISLQYHTAFQGPDVMNAANPTEVQTRSTYYNVPGVPYITMDGNVFIGIPDNLDQPEIDSRKIVLSPFALTISHQLSVTNDSVYITAVLRADQAFNGSIKAFLAVSERHIYFTNAPGTTPQTRFENVMKKMVPDDQGIVLPASWAVNDSIVINESWKLNGVFDTNQIAIVGWIQDVSTKEVIQAAYSRTRIPLDIGVQTAEFNDVICPGKFLAKIKVKNYGTDVLTSCTVGFITSGGTNSTHSWTGIMDPETTGIIALDTIDPLKGLNTLETAALIPNLGIDYDPKNDSNFFHFTVVDTVITPPFSEGFESLTFPPAHWSISNKNNDLTWEKDAISSFEGTNSAKMSFYTGTKLRKDELYLPAMDFSTTSLSMKLYFNYAYTFFSDVNTSRYDSLLLMASTDCGDNWTTLWEKGGANLQTAPAIDVDFIPSISDWKSDSVDLSSFNGVSQVLIKFSGKSGRGNNLLLDKIIVNDTPTGVEDIANNPGFTIYPIPVKDVLIMSITGNNNRKESGFCISDIFGKIMMVKSQLNVQSGIYKVDLNALDNGVYFVTLTEGKLKQTRKIVVIH